MERLLILHDSRHPPPSGQIDKITDKVVQSTLEYAMDSPELSIHDYNSQDTASQSQDSCDDAEQVYKLYFQAYHSGLLHPRLMEVFTRGACFPRLFLEDPDRECCARSIGRPVRKMIWKIFVISGGIPDRPDLDSPKDDNVCRPQLKLPNQMHSHG